MRLGSLIDTHAHLSRWDVYDHADELVREARRRGYWP